MKTDLKLRANQKLTHAEVDANFERLAYLQGAWVAGTYTQWEVVTHRGGMWCCEVASTSSEPSTTSGQWSLCSPDLGSGLATLSSETAGSDLGAGWNALTEIDTENDTRSLGVSFTLATGRFNFAWPGVWRIGLSLYFEHNESTSSRETNVRLYNVDSTSVLASQKIPVFKNQIATMQSISFLVHITSTDLAADLRFEIGGGSTVTSVVYVNQTVELVQTSPRAVTQAILMGFSYSNESVTALNVANGIYGVGGGSSTETVSDLLVENPRTVTLAAASEADTAQSLAASNPRDYALTAASEATTASTAGVTVTIAAGGAAETDSVSNLTATVATGVYLGSALETDATYSVTFSVGQAIAAGGASETDTPTPLLISKFPGF